MKRGLLVCCLIIIFYSNLLYFVINLFLEGDCTETSACLLHGEAGAGRALAPGLAPGLAEQRTPRPKVAASRFGWLVGWWKETSYIAVFYFSMPFTKKNSSGVDFTSSCVTHCGWSVYTPPATQKE